MINKIQELKIEIKTLTDVFNKEYSFKELNELIEFKKLELNKLCEFMLDNMTFDKTKVVERKE